MYKRNSLFEIYHGLILSNFPKAVCIPQTKSYDDDPAAVIAQPPGLPVDVAQFKVTYEAI
jgi:hypothetical protein